MGRLYRYESGGQSDQGDQGGPKPVYNENLTAVFRDENGGFYVYEFPDYYTMRQLGIKYNSSQEDLDRAMSSANRPKLYIRTADDGSPQYEMSSGGAESPSYTGETYLSDYYNWFEVTPMDGKMVLTAPRGTE